MALIPSVGRELDFEWLYHRPWTTNEGYVPVILYSGAKGTVAETFSSVYKKVKHVFVIKFDHFESKFINGFE